MKIENTIEVGSESGGNKPSPYTIDQRPVIDTVNGIQARTKDYIFNIGRKPISLINGSVQADIVVNAVDRAAVNTECDETKKLLNEEREARREVYFRQARLLYPEKEEWCLSLAIDAFMEQEEKGIDIIKHKFAEEADKY
jgi:hypothetical protein